MTGSPLDAVRSAWGTSDGPSGVVSGVGIDMVEIASLDQLLVSGGTAFLDNGWSPQEQRDAEGSAARLAVRWAGKEAVMKALQRGIGDVDPLDVEILTEADGSPKVVLHGNALVAASACAVRGWHVSLCHEAGWAVAIAIADRHSFLPEPMQTHEGNGDG